MRTKWGQKVLQQGQMLKTDSADSEQRGRTGSEVSALTPEEERSVLLCWLVLDVTSVARNEPASCVGLFSSAGRAYISHLSVSSVSHSLWQRHAELEVFCTVWELECSQLCMKII